MTTNYNINKNLNMISVLNNNNKINNLIMANNIKAKKIKKNNDINNKNINIKTNKINNLKNIEDGDSERNDLNIPISSEDYNMSITKEEKNILIQIETLVYQLLNNCSSPKKIILKEIENIYKNAIDLCNNEVNPNYLGTETDIPCRKKSNSNLNISKKNSKKNLETDQKLINEPKNNTNNNKNKDNIEKELNILNKKYNQIKEENINLKYLITEKTTAFEDVKNSLKSFQKEINQLKNNNNHNSFRNKNNENNSDKNSSQNNNNIIINSKGLEMKNVKLNLSNVQRVNEIQDLSSAKNRQKENNSENLENNLFNCNNYSFGQNNSLEINFENSNNSKKDLLNSNRSIDLLSLTFHDNIDNLEDIQQNEMKQEINLKNYDFSPSLRKATEILIQTGIMPNKNEKKNK